MAVGFETRAPFLDHNVATFAFSLSSNYKIKRKNFSKITKWCLREILKKYLPENLTNGSKSGFAMPLGKWLRGPLREWAETLFDKNTIINQGFLNHEKIKILWSDHLNYKNDNTEILWRILMWQSWIEINC